MSTIYRCLVRPHLEYCVQCWCPTPRFGNWGLILSIEKVQRKVTRLVNDIGTLSYGARLTSLKLSAALRHHLPLQVDQLCVSTGVRILGWQERRG